MYDFNLDTMQTPEYKLVLHKMTEEPIAELHNISSLVVRRDLLGIDEISFRVDKNIIINNSYELNPLYDIINGNQLIQINDMDMFLVLNPQIISDADGEYKLIKAFSRQYELKDKKLMGFTGVSRLVYSPENELDPAGIEIGFLNYVERVSGWKVRYVNKIFYQKYRELNFNNVNIIQALKDIQSIFGCMIYFDTKTKSIDVFDVTQMGDNKGVYISDKSFISALKQTVNDENIVTRLYLYGKNNISVQSISLTGQPYVEDFSYFMNEEYMTKGLLDGLQQYYTNLNNKEGQFNRLLAEKDKLHDELSILQIDISTKKLEMRLIDHNIDIAIADSNDVELAKEQENKRKLQIEIDDMQSKINTKMTQITSKETEIINLRKSININLFLTDAQIKELKVFVKEDRYQENTYIEETLDELLEEGLYLLSRSTQPTLKFEITNEDFLSLAVGRDIRTKMILGDIFNIEHEELNFYQEVRLIGFVQDIDNHTLTLKFSNKDDPYDDNILEEVIRESSMTNSTVGINQSKWDTVTDIDNDFRDYINSELDLAKQAVTTGEGQRPILDYRGLWLYKELPDGKIDPEQIRAVNNVIAITKDNWNTVEVAITPEGVKANQLIGDIILGTNLKIVSNSGVVEILDNLITIRDDGGRPRVEMGNYANGKYGLRITSKDGRTTLIDEDGILQTWQEGRTDNIDTGKPLRLYVYLDEKTRVINKTLLRFKMENFRAYSSTTDTEQTREVTSLGGGGEYTSTENSRAESDTSESDGAWSDTTGGGGGDYATTHDASNVRYTWGDTTLVQGHRHEVYKVDHHEHELRLPSHVHSFRVPTHTHRFSLPRHYHDIRLREHHHTVVIPPHSHKIQYGIFESSKSSNINIHINGFNRTMELGGGTGFNTDQSKLDITKYMLVGRWNVIDIYGTGLGRIDATAFVQVLMNV